MFEIDFKRWIALMLPAKLRRPLIFGILRAAVLAVEYVYECFSVARINHIFRLTHNGQVCHLRGTLNYLFGGGFRIGSIKREGAWLYAVTETGEMIPVAVEEAGGGVPVLYSMQMLNMAENDFAVFVPARVWDRIAEVTATVDRYKLVTKRAHYVKVADPVSTLSLWNRNKEFNSIVQTILIPK